MLDDDDRLSFIKLGDPTTPEGKPLWSYNEPARPAPGSVCCLPKSCRIVSDESFLR